MQKIKFCWHCSRKLRGKHFSLHTPKEDGIARVVHKECKKECKKELELPLSEQGIVDANHIDEEIN